MHVIVILKRRTLVNFLISLNKQRYKKSKLMTNLLIKFKDHLAIFN